MSSENRQPPPLKGLALIRFGGWGVWVQFPAAMKMLCPANSTVFSSVVITFVWVALPIAWSSEKAQRNTFRLTQLPGKPSTRATFKPPQHTRSIGDTRTQRKCSTETCFSSPSTKSFEKPWNHTSDLPLLLRKPSIRPAVTPPYHKKVMRGYHDTALLYAWYVLFFYLDLIRPKNGWKHASSLSLLAVLLRCLG